MMPVAESILGEVAKKEGARDEIVMICHQHDLSYSELSTG
jgi:hypothetical protein